jgi:HK97 family phage prohead protease
VIARLSAGAAGHEAAALLKEGAVAGLSFGYRVRKFSGAAPRALEEVELVEVSLVSVPMQPRARVHAMIGECPNVKRIESPGKGA